MIFDNFSSGKEAYLRDLRGDRRLEVVIGDLKKKEAVVAAMRDCEVVIHLAANPDIAKAVEQPDIDFWEGTFLAQNVLEAMRINGVKRMAQYTFPAAASPRRERGGPLCGDPRALPADLHLRGEQAGQCEAHLGAYCHMFGLTARERSATPTSSGRGRRTGSPTTSSAG